jgi:hypothetical protein
VGNPFLAAPHIAGSQHPQGSLPQQSIYIYIVDRGSPGPGINHRREKSAKKIKIKCPACSQNQTQRSPLKTAQPHGELSPECSFYAANER